MWYLTKQALIPLAYLLFAATIASGVYSIENCPTALIIVLLILNLALYLFVVITLSAKEGETGYNVLITNDANRRMIIQTGEDLPLKHAEEYAPWKGFAIGGIISLPLIILLLIHTIFLLTGSPNEVPGAIASFLYMVVFAFTRIEITSTVGMYDYYSALLFVPVVCLACGVAYIYGAMKIERQQRMIKKIHKEIHGDDDCE